MDNRDRYSNDVHEKPVKYSTLWRRENTYKEMAERAECMMLNKRLFIAKRSPF
ncbi:hypothetical protein [Nostoc sp.]